jgi:hypothetical protein
LYDVLGFRQLPLDQEAHQLFWDVMYNDELSYGQRLQAYDDLSALIWDEYGIDFESVWDWDDFRSWYETA